MNKTIFITGANRGVGFEFVRQYAEDGCNVIATCRDTSSAKELIDLANQMGNITVEALDIGDQPNIKSIAEKYNGQAIDILVNNAGIIDRVNNSIMEASRDSMIELFNINFFGTLAITQALLPNILKSETKRIITLSTKVSSIDDNRSGGKYGYRCSKIALNMAMKNIALEYKKQGLRIILLHPGWVRTSMGGKLALISTEKSVAGMRETMAKYIDESLANFYDYKGEVIPW